MGLNHIYIIPNKIFYIEGFFASRELNWATCNHNRLCRGYFLGGNVLSGVKITEDHGLVLDITQD